MVSAPRASAIRAVSFARRVGSLSGQAPPPSLPISPVPTGTAARPCGPSGALGTGGAFAADVARRVALMPSYGCQPAISHAIPPVTLSNIEFALLELRHFQALLKLHPIELHAELGDEDSSL